MARSSTVNLNGNIVDLSGPPQDVVNPKYFLLTLQDKPRPNLRTLQAAGIEILDYEGNSVYSCRLLPSTGDASRNIDKLRELSPVVRVDPYPASAKIHRELQEDIQYLAQQGSAGGSGGDAALPPGTGSSGPSAPTSVKIRVKIRLHSTEPIESIQDVVKKLVDSNLVNESDCDIGESLVNATIDSKSLVDVAALDSVAVIESCPDKVPYNNLSRLILAADAPRLPNNDTVLDGSGEIIAIGDTGLDNGIDWKDDPQGPHAAFASTRPVQRLYIWSKPDVVPTKEKLKDTRGHGTHVAGSAVGCAQDGKMMGTAPGASLIALKLDRSTGTGKFWDKDMKTIFAKPYELGARVFNESWGADLNKKGEAYGYNTDSREIDQYIWKRPDVFVCWAAGNERLDVLKKGADKRQLGAESLAKNVLTVGASFSTRHTETTTTGEDVHYEYNETSAAGDAFAMAAFSNEGPVGKRFKPDVVAPGTLILSARSRSLEGDDLARVNDCGTSIDPNYMFKSGTSMASPFVAGCGAVLRQAVKQTKPDNGPNTIPYKNPSSALLKALIINGAVPLSTGTVPNAAWGFGRVNLQASLRHVVETNLNEVGNYGFKQGTLKLDERYKFSVNITKGKANLTGEDLLSRLKVTMVYIDSPGSLIACKLSLKVQRDADTTVCFGNSEQSGGEYDQFNNVQQITWRGMKPGSYTVEVYSDDVPLGLDFHDVHFATAWCVSEMVDSNHSQAGLLN